MMNRLAVCLLLCSATSTLAADGKSPPTLRGSDFLTSPGRQWTLLWSDEFNGDTLDAKKWTLGLSWVGDDGTNRHHNGLYASVIADQDVAVSGGSLHLTCRKVEVPNPRGGVYEYTEGLIQSDGKFAHTYGYAEVRCRVPADAGPGLWPAFWTLSKGWPPENDIGEFWTADNRLHQGLAFKQKDGGVGWDDRNTYVPLPRGWHTYGLEWGPGFEVFNIDGKVTHVVTGRRVPAVPMYILLNSGVDANAPPTEATKFPNDFEVDYVRVYRQPLPDGPTLANGSFEGDLLAPWSSLNDATAARGNSTDGRKSLRLAGAPAGGEQAVFQLKPDTEYVLTAKARLLDQAEPARLGVKDYGGEEKWSPAESPRFAPVSVTFRTGPKSTSAVIYCFKPVGKGLAFFDDVRLEPRVAAGN